MINIYGPQDLSAKAILWNRIGDFMHQHAGTYIIFGDMNSVCNENKRSGSLFSRQDADNFNSFIENSSLIDLPLGGRLFTWMNKAGTKLSKLDRFLISEEVVEALPDVRVTAIDRLRSDHNLILLHVSKSDFGTTLFKLFHSWLLRDSFDEVIKMELPKLEEHNFGRKLLSHEKFRLLKARIKQWHSETKASDRVTKHNNLQRIKSIEEKIEAGSTNDDDSDSRIKLLQEVDIFVTFESSDLFQNTRTLFFLILALALNGVLGLELISHPGLQFSSMVVLPQKHYLRQGDPLSPFLFILVMEGLHNAVFTAVISGLIRGVKFSSPEVFYLASSLKINIQKSNVYGIGVLDVDVSSMASNSGCASRSFPFTYLGLPIGSNMSLTSSWQ
ncbi:RNA-directed DNA polymerase, eukaryota, reverse transcriptase zinc-binding domain protein, partial [Tanacetum coccineum]